MISLAVPATAVPLSATASAIIATITAGGRRFPFNIRFLSVSPVRRRPDGGGLDNGDKENVRVGEARPLDPIVPMPHAVAATPACGTPNEQESSRS